MHVQRMVRSNYGTSTSHFSKGLEPIQKICSVGKGASMVEARVENKSFFALMDSGAAVSLVNSDFASENRFIWRKRYQISHIGRLDQTL